MQHHPTLPHDTPSLAKPESEADAVLILSPRDLCTSRLSPDDFHPYNRFLKEASAVFARMLDQNCQEWIHFYQHVTEFTQCRPSLAVRYRSFWERSWSEQDLITRWADQMQLCSSSTARHVFVCRVRAGRVSGHHCGHWVNHYFHATPTIIWAPEGYFFCYSPPRQIHQNSLPPPL